MKTAIWNKSFRMFVSGYNRGLRTARYNPSTPLAELRGAEEDSDGEEVLYGEDDRPLPEELLALQLDLLRRNQSWGMKMLGLRGRRSCLSWALRDLGRRMLGLP